MSAQLQQLDQVHALLNRFPWGPNELIGGVQNRAGEDPLERLALAAALARELHQLSDSVLGYFVDAARQGGRPWSEIGMALGVSKQAAQQRFVSPDLSRYTDRACRALDMATHAACRLGHRWVRDEHVLIGLAQVTDGVAAKALNSFGVSVDLLHEKIAEFAGGATARLPETASPTVGVAKLLGERAPAEATALGHNYIGTEHMLLAILRQPEGMGANILNVLSVEIDQVRARVLQLMSGIEPADPSR